MTQIYTKNVGLFLVLPAPLNPIGAFDAEQFKLSFRTIMGHDAGFKFVAVDLSGLDFVYSDAYNAFIQCHQELSNKNGAFAVIADKDSLSNSLKKVGLERFIRIFMSEAEMAAFTPIESPKETTPAGVASAVASVAANASKKDPPTARVAVVEKIDPSAYEKPVEKPAPEEPKVLDKNPLEDDEPSSKSMVFVVVVLLLIAVAAAAYFLM